MSPSAVEKLTASLEKNPADTLTCLDGHINAITSELLAAEIAAAVPAGLPADQVEAVTDAVVFRLMLEASAAVGNFSTSQCANLAQATRFRLLARRFRASSLARKLFAETEVTFRLADAVANQA